MKNKIWPWTIFLIDLEKWDFWHICDNWPNSLLDSSQTKCQITKRKLILESPDLPLPNKIKICILDIHRTSYEHLKGWSIIKTLKIIVLRLWAHFPFLSTLEASETLRLPKLYLTFSGKIPQNWAISPVLPATCQDCMCRNIINCLN